MTNQQSSPAVPQFVVTVSLTGLGQSTRASYSYTVPQDDGGWVTFQNISKCDLVIFRSTNCLFVLDYKTTLAGWYIHSITTSADNSSLSTLAGPLNLSYMTIDPDQVLHQYDLTINYCNGDTTVPIDPQETNVPPKPEPGSVAGRG